MIFNVGDKVKLKEKLRGTSTSGKFGRLRFGRVYEVLSITKQGHILLQTNFGKTHYAVHQFING